MFANSTFVRNALGTVGAALFAAACFGAATAPAAASLVTVSKTVRYADLNLGNEAGRAALQARIKSAAKSVCTTGGNDLVSRDREDRCVKAAVAGATQARS